LPPGWQAVVKLLHGLLAMTLTLTVTLVAIWALVSIPASLMIVSLMRVEPDGHATL